MFARYAKNLLMIMIVATSAFTVGCDKDKKNNNANTVATAAKQAFDGCVSRMTRYGGNYVYYCYEVRGYYACSLNEYIGGRCGLGGSTTPVYPGQDYNVYINNYFSSYLTQFPQQEIDILVQNWNRIY